MNRHRDLQHIIRRREYAPGTTEWKRKRRAAASALRELRAIERDVRPDLAIRHRNAYVRSFLQEHDAWYAITSRHRKG